MADGNHFFAFFNFLCTFFSFSDSFIMKLYEWQVNDIETGSICLDLQ